MSAAQPEWTSIALLGTLHGVNPAMGWLFAVSLGLQAQRRGAVWSALAPLALGHALAVATALAAAALLGVVLPHAWVKWIAAALLLGVGVSHLRRHSHPRWSLGGMCVGARQLSAWSFVVSSAHGAGLMVVPFVLRSVADGGDSQAQPVAAHAVHLASVAPTDGAIPGMLATLLHTAAYLAASGAIAWLVYEKLGLHLLRRAWINVDVIWAVALIATAALTAVS
jgi:hypothetical protein